MKLLFLVFCFLAPFHARAITEAEAIYPLAHYFWGIAEEKIPTEVEDFLKMPLPKEVRKYYSGIQVGGQSFKRPKTVSDLLELIDSVHNTIKKGPGKKVRLILPNAGIDLLVRRKKLGEGARSIVYRVKGSSKKNHWVIKIAKPQIAGLLRMNQERVVASDLSQLVPTLSPEQKIDIPKINTFDDFGLVAVKEEIQGENLAEFLFRIGVLYLAEDPLTKKDRFRVNYKILREAEINLEILTTSILQLIRSVQSYPSLITDIKPTNIMVELHKNYPHRVVWVDISKSIEKSLPYRELKELSFANYLRASLSKLNELYSDNLLTLPKGAKGHPSKLPNYLKCAISFN